MTSVITAVFKATAGLLVSEERPRDKTDKTTADKLKEDDVTHRKFCSLTVRKTDSVKSKVDRFAARKDLLAGISFLKEGIAILYQVFEKTNGDDHYTGTVQATAAGKEKDDLVDSLQSEAALACSKTVSLVKGLNNFQLIISELDESAAEEALFDAKRRFEDARRKATEAFGNEALKTCDRILAMVVRVTGTILEKVDNPANALAACSVCLEELHALAAVQKCFNVKPAKGFKFASKKDERTEIVAGVLNINRVIQDVMQLVDSSKQAGLLVWPCVDVEAENLRPFHDPRVAPQNNLDVTLRLM